METESTSNSKGMVIPQCSNKKYESPLHIIFNCSYQRYLTKVIKLIVKDEVSLQTTGSRLHIITHCMADYTAILSYLPEHNFHHFTFVP
jgi:hypothetical protein